MCKVEILGKEKENEFFQERLINLKAVFLDTIKKSKLKTGIKSGKSQKVKFFQLFKWIAKHLDLLLTYP